MASNQDKTRALLKELDNIEKKAHAMKSETERLRKIKDDAKLALSSRYPDLFANASKTSYDFSTTSVATQSDDSIELEEDIGLNRNHLSKDLQDVYDTLMNFQKRDISTQSYAYPVETPRSTKYSDDNEHLSEVMAHYGVKLNDNSTPRNEKEYFIPVDYETYTNWLHKGQTPSSVREMAMPQSKAFKKVARAPIPEPEVNKNDVLEEIDPGDDTSQDAADLSSQDAKENELISPAVEEAPMLIQARGEVHKPLPPQPEPKPEPKPEPRISIAKPLPPSPTKRQVTNAKNEIDKKAEIKSESEEEERDENFVIESDNIDDKLYSSESESPGANVKPVQAAITHPKIQPLASSKLSLSSSSTSSPQKPLPEAKKAKPIQLKSESEASESIPVPKTKGAFDDDISGPEMEMEDDFWN